MQPIRQRTYDLNKIRKQDSNHFSDIQMVRLSGIQMALKKPDHLESKLFLTI